MARGLRRCGQDNCGSMRTKQAGNFPVDGFIAQRAVHKENVSLQANAFPRTQRFHAPRKDYVRHRDKFQVAWQWRSSRPGHTVDAMPRENRVVVDRRAAFRQAFERVASAVRCVANLEAARKRYGQRDTRAGIVVDGCEREPSVVRSDIFNAKFVLDFD